MKPIKSLAVAAVTIASPSFYEIGRWSDEDPDG